MPRIAPMNSVCVAALTLSASQAVADITAADVWANQQAYYEATGAQVIGTLVADGDMMVVTDGAVVYRLPLNLGQLQISLPPMRMVENNDGSVTFVDPGEFAIVVNASFDSTPVSMTIGVNHANLSGKAVGQQGDIMYTYQAGPFTVTLLDATLPEPGLTFELNAEGDGYSVQSRVTEGALIVTESTSDVLPVSVNYSFREAGGVTATSTAKYGLARTVANFALPQAGANIMNLTPAFRDGMSFAIETMTQSNASEVSTTLDGALVSSQVTEVGRSSGDISLDQTGLLIDFMADDFLVSLDQPDVLPFPIDFEATQMNGGYQFPILASDTPQDVSFDLGFEGLRFSPGIWALFDAQKSLPRDPMMFGLSIDGTVLSDIDLPDIAAYDALSEQDTLPVSLETLSIGNLALSAIGSSLQGRADMTFDNTDLETFDGFPRPIGDAFFTVSGANRLLDRLIEAGAISSSDASGARLAMGLIARATGDDSFETTVEMNEEGHVSVNGQRMR